MIQAMRLWFGCFFLVLREQQSEHLSVWLSGCLEIGFHEAKE